jgi:hypothetical protein
MPSSDFHAATISRAVSSRLTDGVIELKLGAMRREEALLSNEL